MSDDQKACENTDKEIWRECDGDFRADNIFVTRGAAMTEAVTLADALPNEIKRVQEKRERWLGYGQKYPNMMVGPACAMMQAEIDEGIAALASGDVFRMLRAHEALLQNSSDD